MYIKKIKLLQAVLVVFVLLFALQAPSYAAGINVDRIAGNCRYETAVKISQTGWPSANTVILARGDNYADALAGVPLAYKLNAPILLTPSNSLEDLTLAEIQRLGATHIIILGGASAVSLETEDQLKTYIPSVERIAGENRFDTAAKIAAQVAPEGVATAIIAYGFNFPDALSVAPYAARAGHPILLTLDSDLPAETLQALTDLGLQNTIIVGGPSVIQNSVQDKLPNPTRINGECRFTTSLALAKHYAPLSKRMYVATGLNFADAITGAALASKNNSGILLAGNPSLLLETENYIMQQAFTGITIFGGEQAVPSNIAERIRTLVKVTHRVRDGKLYGLDFAAREVLITNAPSFLPAGNYVVDKQFDFYTTSSAGLVLQGRFNYLENVPYALLPLDRPASPQVTAALLRNFALTRNTNTTFNESVANAFIQAQESWGINALYLFAHAGLESAWGTSAIARDKHNLFGFQAYDDSPYASAATFRNKEECVLWIGGFIRGSYLSWGNWRFNGNNLAGMNVLYATDPMWSIKIANLMESILPYSQYNQVEKPSQTGRVNSTTELTLRSGPGTNFPLVNKLPNGTEVRIHGLQVSGSHNWLRVSTPLGDGWVSGLYVQLLTQPKATVHLAYWRNDEFLRLNVHSGPSATQTLKDTLTYATPLTVLDMAMNASNELWYKVNYPNSSGESWVRAIQVVVQW